MQKRDWLKGDIIEGRVVSMDRLGAWIDHSGVTAFIPLAEIAWYEIEHPSELLSEGEWVRATIIGKNQQGVYECSVRSVFDDEEAQELVMDVEVNAPKGDNVLFGHGVLHGAFYDHQSSLRVIILTMGSLESGSHLECRIIGVLQMVDQNGPKDRLIAVPTGDHHFQKMFSLSDVPHHLLRQIVHFFKTGEDSGGVKVQIKGWKGIEKARQIVRPDEERLDHS